MFPKMRSPVLKQKIITCISLNYYHYNLINWILVIEMQSRCTLVVALIHETCATLLCDMVQLCLDLLAAVLIRCYCQLKFQSFLWLKTYVALLCTWQVISQKSYIDLESFRPQRPRKNQHHVMLPIEHRDFLEPVMKKCGKLSLVQLQKSLRFAIFVF